MDFLYENVNVYDLINYYKDLHEYFIKNKSKIYNILKGLTNEIIIEENDEEKKKTNNGDFSNFYFFYIQNLKPKIRRSNFRLSNVRELHIKHGDDFLVGLNLSNCKIGSDIRITLCTQNFRKKIFRVIITEKNKNNIFLPINNKNFFPFFLCNLNAKMIIQSNNNIPEIDTIYLKLHRDYSNKFFSFGNYLINLQDNTYLEITDYKVKLYFTNNEIIPNEFLFYCNLDKYYGRKIYNYYRYYKLKRFVKQFLTYEYDLYDDITNTICKFF